MKRIWLVLMLLLCWPHDASALPDTPYDPALMLWYPRLSADQQQVFDLLYSAAVTGTESVELPPETLYRDAEQAMKALLLDCPELCALDPAYSLVYYQDSPQWARTVRLKYVMPVANQQLLVERAGELAFQAYGDEFQREWILHEMLCDQVVYDLEAEDCHNAWGALMEGRAVCDGYAYAMTLLMRLSYMECGVVVGRTAREADPDAYHAWNLLKVDGSYTWLDVTNDDQAVRGYFYFNLTNDWLERSYVLTPQYMPQAELPACTDESVNWHVKNYRYVQGGNMELHIFNNFRNLAREGTLFALRFEWEREYADFRDNLQAWTGWYNENAAPGEQVQERLSLYMSPQQKCVVVEFVSADGN